MLKLFSGRLHEHLSHQRQRLAGSGILLHPVNNLLPQAGLFVQFSLFAGLLLPGKSGLICAGLFAIPGIGEQKIARIHGALSGIPDNAALNHISHDIDASNAG